MSDFVLFLQIFKGWWKHSCLQSVFLSSVIDAMFVGGNAMNKSTIRPKSSKQVMTLKINT